MPLNEDRRTSSDALQEEARIWVRRLASDEVTQWDIQAVKRWQKISPAHQAAFEEAKRQWHQMKPVLGELLQARPKVAAFHDRALRGAVMGRRALLGAAVSTAAVAAIVVVHPPLGLWPAAKEWNADYRTATGEQRNLALADRVSVTLNTQTSIRRHATNEVTTGIDLITGEAAVDLLAGGKFFRVMAGVGRSVAESGRFEVRHLDGKSCVTCLDGVVRVEHPSGMRTLRALQQTVYDAGSISRVTSIEPATAVAWRNGALVFEQTPLSVAIDEINRYRPGRVVLMARAMQDNTVSGRFSIAALDGVLLQIQHSFDLKARSLPGDVLILS
ncbi:FecR family protein [Variovorax sp. LT1R16]|uniref:FecR family protein n=1 Tax=Variovorax sp. LT1R16 TaxID=3443728 RepID=UPI003F4724C2